MQRREDVGAWRVGSKISGNYLRALLDRSIGEETLSEQICNHQLGTPDIEEH
jgi:hypothetical protein